MDSVFYSVAGFTMCMCDSPERVRNLLSDHRKGLSGDTLKHIILTRKAAVHAKELRAELTPEDGDIQIHAFDEFMVSRRVDVLLLLFDHRQRLRMSPVALTGPEVLYESEKIPGKSRG